MRGKIKVTGSLIQSRGYDNVNDVADSNRIFDETVHLYRKAVSFFVDVCLKEWKNISAGTTQKERVNLTESVTIKTKRNPTVPYDFAAGFYKFPSYLRRAAIAEALGKVSSYQSSLANWEASVPGIISGNS